MIKSLSFKKGVCEQLAKGEGRGRRRGEEGAGESNKKNLQSSGNSTNTRSIIIFSCAYAEAVIQTRYHYLDIFCLHLHTLIFPCYEGMTSCAIVCTVAMGVAYHTAYLLMSGHMVRPCKINTMFSSFVASDSRE